MKSILLLTICLIGFTSYSQQPEEITYFHDKIIGSWDIVELQSAGSTEWFVLTPTEKAYISKTHLYGPWNKEYEVLFVGLITTANNELMRFNFISENCIRIDFADGSKMKICR